MFKVTTDDLRRMPRACQYTHHIETAFRFVSYKAWISEGEPNPFVARAALKKLATQQEELDVLEEIDPFEISRQAQSVPRPITLVRDTNGLMRPGHLRERRYQLAA